MKNWAVFALLLIALFTFRVSAAARDEWIQIKSKNFLLVGNASEKDIRKVGTRLEEFRETFRLLFTNMNLISQVPVNVIVFRNSASYKQFKPRLEDGRIDTSIAGYFQAGDDVNYITLSVEGEDAHTFGVIFHEYVHSIVNLNFGRSEVPAWFNEGLAEYYETFTIENDQKVKVGLPQPHHLALLQQKSLIPLQTILNFSNSQLSNSGDTYRDFFYSESWALTHYLIQRGKSDALNKFLALVLSGNQTDRAFQDAFQTTYLEMENQLRMYVSQSKFNYREFIFSRKLEFDTAMRVSALDEVGLNSILGDLLAHTHREDEAEPYLLAALKLQPSASLANTTMGMIKMRQKKYGEAKQYLEKAIAGDQTTYRAFYDYAYVLSREGSDDFGYVREFSKGSAAKMRDALNKAVALNPAFAESYELLAFIDVANNENFEDAAALMQKALAIQPGNENYAMRLAEIYIRQNKYDAAGIIVDRITKTTDLPDLRRRAENLGLIVKQRREMELRQAAERKLHPDTANQDFILPTVPSSPVEKPMTEAEIARAKAEIKIRAINHLIRQPSVGEKRIIGRLQKIDCRGNQIFFVVKTSSDTLTLVRTDFVGLDLKVFVDSVKTVEIGCEASLSGFNALVTIKPAPQTRINARAELIAIEFVPGDFRLMTADELKQPPPRIVAVESVDANGVALPNLPDGRPPDIEKRRQDTILRGIKDALRQPAAGETREIGYLDKIECTNDVIIFNIRTATRTLRLLDAIPKSQPIQIFDHELDGTRFDCSLKPVEFPAVFNYVAMPNDKSQTAGSITSLDFVPKPFVLN